MLGNQSRSFSVSSLQLKKNSCKFIPNTQIESAFKTYEQGKKQIKIIIIICAFF